MEKQGKKWRGFYRDHRGAKRSKTFGRQREALSWARSKESEASRLTGDLVLFEDFWNEWWAGHRITLRPKTVDLIESIARVHLLPRFGALAVQEISTMDIQVWVNDLDRSGKSPHTVRNYAFRMRSVMAAAVERRMILANPFDQVSVPKVQQREMCFLDFEQLMRLAATAGYYGSLIRFLGVSGLRFGEAAGLYPSDFGTDMKSVSVRRQLFEAGGKLQEGPPKTKAGRRTVGLPSKLSTHLMGFSEEAGQIKYFFETPSATPLRLSAFHHNVWSKLAVGEFQGLRVHDLRHTAISMWIRLGADPKLVAAMAGHSSTQRVFDLYGHLYPNADASLMSSLDDALE